MIVIAVGVIITLATVFSRNDIFYCFVVIWALVGILLKRIADNSMPDQLVIIASIVGIVSCRTWDYCAVNKEKEDLLKSF